MDYDRIADDHQKMINKLAKKQSKGQFYSPYDD